MLTGQQQLRGAVPTRDHVLSHEVALRAASGMYAHCVCAFMCVCVCVVRVCLWANFICMQVDTKFDTCWERYLLMSEHSSYVFVCLHMHVRMFMCV